MHRNLKTKTEYDFNDVKLYAYDLLIVLSFSSA